MRLGLFGARADRRGLATMTTEFAAHMKPDRILGIDLGGCDWSGYRKALEVHRLRDLSDDVVRSFLDGLDVCYMAETDYDPHRPGKRYITAIARDEGCKLVLHAMPELCRFAEGSPSRRPREPKPDLIVLPTPWLQDRFPESVVLPFPVNRAVLPFVHRRQGWRFLHVAGKPAMKDRAGTTLVQRAKPKAEVVVKLTQQKGRGGHGIEVIDRPNYHDVYEPYDVLLAPRRYGGQSLPVMEAMSSGMPVIALDREPERDWLPPETLVPTTLGRKARMMGGDVHVFDADPQALAEVIDTLASSPALVSELSEYSNQVASQWSWEELGPKWRELLESV